MDAEARLPVLQLEIVIGGSLAEPLESSGDHLVAGERLEIREPPVLHLGRGSERTGYTRVERELYAEIRAGREATPGKEIVVVVVGIDGFRAGVSERVLEPQFRFPLYQAHGLGIDVSIA